MLTRLTPKVIKYNNIKRYLKTMPTCCVKNCISRTDHTHTRNLKFFLFPKDVNIHQQWLNACQKNEIDLKIDSGK